MKNGKKRELNQNTTPRRLINGMLICIAINVMALIVFSKLIQSGKIEENKISYVTGAILLISSLTGNCIAQITIRKNRLIVFGIITYGYTMVLLAINALLFNGIYGNIGPMLLMISCGGAAALILCLNDKKGSKNKRSKKSYC